MLKPKQQKLYFRKNGFIIEFTKYNKYSFFYNIKKSLGFALDILIYILSMMLLTFIFNVPILNSFLYSYLIFLLYIFMQFFILKNKTLGMVLAGLVVGSYDCKKVDNSKILIRSFLMSIYAIPIVGVILMLTTIISAITQKGLTPLDIFSKTQIFSNVFYKYVNDIYQNIKE